MHVPRFRCIFWHPNHGLCQCYTEVRLACGVHSMDEFYGITRHTMVVLEVSDRLGWHSRRQIVELEAKNIAKVGTFKASVEPQLHHGLISRNARRELKFTMALSPKIQNARHSARIYGIQKWIISLPLYMTNRTEHTQWTWSDILTPAITLSIVSPVESYDL